MGPAVDQRFEDTVVASSRDAAAPEHRFELVIRKEFDRELPTVKLMVQGPSGPGFELTDPRQLEILVGLIRRALPHFRNAEQQLHAEWQEWRNALAPPSSLSSERSNGE